MNKNTKKCDHYNKQANFLNKKLFNLLKEIVIGIIIKKYII